MRISDALVPAVHNKFVIISELLRFKELL
jgi:hypothetical protein